MQASDADRRQPGRERRSDGSPQDTPDLGNAHGRKKAAVLADRHRLPLQRGNVSLSNLQVLNAAAGMFLRRVRKWALFRFKPLEFLHQMRSTAPVILAEKPPIGMAGVSGDTITYQYDAVKTL